MTCLPNVVARGSVCVGKASTRYACITRIAFTNQAVEPHLHGTAMYSVQTTSSLQNQLVLQAHPYNTAKSGQLGCPVAVASWPTSYT
jgi:hypothetical protein